MSKNVDSKTIDKEESYESDFSTTPTNSNVYDSTKNNSRNRQLSEKNPLLLFLRNGSKSRFHQVLHRLIK